MSQLEKLLIKILSGTADNNISFNDLRKLLITLGFNERIKGDHLRHLKENNESRCDGYFVSG